MYIRNDIRIDNHKLSYRFYSGGSRYLFLFHGFGQSSAVFESFISSVSSEFTVIAIDLFFHGESVIEKGAENYISIAIWNEIFDAVLNKHAISTFSILSFSIGARFALATIQYKKSVIDAMVFIAPDGFGNNVWFTLATYTHSTRAVFKWMLAHPGAIVFFARAFHFFGITDSVTQRFIERNIEHEEQRNQIYNTWVYFRKLKMPVQQFISLLKESKVKLMCLVGTKDQLVAIKSIRRICLQTQSTYIECDYSHYKMLQTIDTAEVRTFLISNGKQI